MLFQDFARNNTHTDAKQQILDLHEKKAVFEAEIRCVLHAITIGHSDNSNDKIWNLCSLIAKMLVPKKIDQENLYYGWDSSTF